MEKEIREYINEIASEKGIMVNDSMNLYECGIMDSMETILFLTFLNEKMHIKIDFSDLNFENFISINAILKWVTQSQEGIISEKAL